MILKVEPFQETLHISMCGPASLKIVLKFLGIEKTEKDLAKMTGWNKRLGVDGQGIKNAAEKLGFKVEMSDKNDFRDIQKWLKRGVPVIVNWFTRGRSDYSDSEIADGHYSVVAGLDRTFIYLQDPELGKIRKIKRHDFLRVWFDFRGDYMKRGELIIRRIIAIHK